MLRPGAASVLIERHPGIRGRAHLRLGGSTGALRLISHHRTAGARSSRGSVSASRWASLKAGAEGQPRATTPNIANSIRDVIAQAIMIASIQPQYLSTEDSAKPSFARAMRYECWRLALNVSSVSHQFGGAGGADDAAGAGGAGRRRGCQELASVPGFGPITLKAAGTALHRCPEVHDVATSAAAPAPRRSTRRSEADPPI